MLILISVYLKIKGASYKVQSMEILEDSKPIKMGVIHFAFTHMGLKKRDEMGRYIKSNLFIWIK